MTCDPQEVYEHIKTRKISFVEKYTKDALASRTPKKKNEWVVSYFSQMDKNRNQA